jgi:hypothetical protein
MYETIIEGTVVRGAGITKELTDVQEGNYRTLYTRNLQSFRPEVRSGSQTIVARNAEPAASPLGSNQ